MSASTPGDSRNLIRIKYAQQQNNSITGTSIPIHIRIQTGNSIHLYIPEPLHLEENLPPPSDERLHLVRQILRAPLLPISDSPFKFELSAAAISHNDEVLRSANYDLKKVITNAPFSTSTPGSEFRPVTDLDQLLKNHKLWPFIRTMLLEGADMHLRHEPIDEQRRKENDALIDFNNHKKARENPDIIGNSILKDIRLGFCTPISISTIQNIPNAMVCPLGIVEQQTLAYDGTRKTKLRLTHDQTFTILPESESVNNLTDTTPFPELIYGQTLSRIIYQALSMRWHYPASIILCGKYDFSSAYRRCHYNGKSAAQCISVHEGIAFILWRLSFGGTGCPFSWCPIGEIITDLANDLLANPNWDPKTCGPTEPLPDLPVERLPTDIHLAQTMPTMTLPPARAHGFNDVYVDDTITLFVDTPQNVTRAPKAIATATATIARPSCTNEPLPREHLLSIDKYMAEGAPSEVKTILGWTFNFRSLTISLPSDKHAAWSSDIGTITTTKQTTKKNLEQVIGRLNHVCHVIPIARYFIGPLRHLHQIGKHNRSTLKINNRNARLLSFWASMLDKAHSGINFNLMTARVPTNITITDACPSGLGGFSVSTGRAWRFPLNGIPDSISNNVLEFTAAAIGIIIESHSGNIPPLGQVLALTDNSSALGWLHKLNANPTSTPELYEVATSLARTCINNDFSIHPQHIRGCNNGIADALSRRNDLSDDQLTSFIHSSFSSQLPRHFNIFPVPADVASWVYSTLQTLQASCTAQQKTPTKSPTALGDDGTSSSHPSALPPTPTSTTSIQNNASQSQKPSFKQYEKEISPNNTSKPEPITTIRKNYEDELYKRPLASWLRNSRALDDPALFTSKTMPTSWILTSDDYIALGRKSTLPHNEKSL